MQTGIFGDIPIARISGKDTRYANRGINFERLINGTNDIYDAENRAVMVKQNVEIKRIYSQGRELKGAFPTGKSIVDYLGQVNIGDICIPCAIEAKHSDGKAIALDRVQPHQKEFLSKWTRHKAIGIVLVWLQGAPGAFGQAFAIPSCYWELAATAGEQKRPMDLDIMCGMRWRAPGKKSLNNDDMHPAWRVDIGLSGVRWLETIERWQI